MVVFVLLLLSGCSYFPQDVHEEVVTQEMPTSADFSQNVDHIIERVGVLWKNKKNKDKREAQKILMNFYEEKAQHVFAFLHSDHANDILAAEHQLGWVIHRLDRHTSRSFNREAGYLEKLSRHLKVCGSFLPAEIALELPSENIEEISKSPIKQRF